MTKKTSNAYYKGERYALKSAHTERYVWHLTYPQFREQIQAKGLVPMHGLLFANNQNEKTSAMWHWDLEFGECLGYEALAHDPEMIEKYLIDRRRDLDFWRIDTKYAKAKWYQDPNFDGVRNFYGEDLSHRYICTPCVITPTAIRLFTFDSQQFDRVNLRMSEGVVHCEYSPLPLRRAG